MPDFFFKYYTADSLKLTLSKNTRKWSSPVLFNDPFDNRWDLQWAGSTIDLEKSVKKFIIRQVEKETLELNIMHPDIRLLVSQIRVLSPTDRAVYLEQFNELKNIYTQSMLDAWIIELNKDAATHLSDTSIFCLTEDFDNLLMWAHYADNHRGGVIKFLPVRAVDSPLLVARKVTYSKQIPTVDFVSLLGDTFASSLAIRDAITLTKSLDWQYEKEWRIVSALRNPASEYEIISFAEEEVGGLYLGCRMAEKDKSELIEIMAKKYPWAPIYQATPKKSEFSLAFEKI